MKFKIWIENQQQWKSHIQSLIFKHQNRVVQDIANGGFPYFDADDSIAHIYKSIDSTINYWDHI
jgi:uncharacterized protein YfaQ (DUF2300 family)